MDLAQLDRNTMDGVLVDVPTGSTINGKLGDLYNCSVSASASEGAVEEEDGFVLEVESGKTYLLRLMNAALFSEYYLKIAGHTITVVASDANYVKPYATDTVAIAPGETMDVLVAADAPPGRYYMAALAIQAPEPDVQVPLSITRGIVQYSNSSNVVADDVVPAPVMMPDMPDQHDTTGSFYFHGNLSSLRRHRVPARADEHMLVTLSLGSVCRDGGQACARSDSDESIIVGTMNDVSFRAPTAAAVSLLEAHYYRRDDMAAAAGVELGTLPDAPRRVFNFTDPAYIPYGPKEAPLEPTEKQTVVRRFRHGAVVEVVFQDTAVMQSDSNPMHLHGHDMFVLAHGLGNYDAARDVASYNLVDPPLKNTVVVPRLGWVAVRFVADNPGACLHNLFIYLHVRYICKNQPMPVLFTISYATIA
jgi:laccase